MANGRFLIPAALLLTLPGLAASARLVSVGPAQMTLATGLTIIAAGIVMLWVARSLRGTPRTLALAVAALAALLPEYSVDAHFAWVSSYHEASNHPSLMLAATTGSNRILMGLGWPLLALLFWLRNRNQRSNPERGFGVQLAPLFLATLYAFIIYIKGVVSVLDTVALLVLFGLFVWRSIWQERADRRVAILMKDSSVVKGAIWALLAGYAALSMYLAAGAFASSFLFVGQRMGIERLVMAQWMLPLVTKAPWLLLAAIFVWRANARLAVSSLLTSQVGLWTLFIGALPLVALISGSLLGNVDSLALDDRQRLELLLTATQSLFAVAVLSRSAVSLRGALAMLALFAAQSLLSALQPDNDATLAHGLFSVVYLAAALAMIAGDRARLRVLTGVIPINIGRMPQRRATRMDRAGL